jgi:hypothetical protein
MKRLSFIILIFAIAFIIFFVAPPLLAKQFGIYPLMKVGDVVDFFTPLILIPLYWLLFRLDKNRGASLTENMVFLLFAVIWVAGHAIHLSANSIGHLLEGMEMSDAYRLTHFYDEVLSHYMWHFGIFGLAALTIYRQLRNPFTDKHPAWWMLIIAGVIHGFSIFLIVIEGETAWLGIPFVILVTLFGLIWGWRRFRQQPLLFFFFVACVVAVLFFTGWGVYWRGLPEFSEVGIID